MTDPKADYTESALFLDTPLLTTERLILRPPHDEDAEELALLANNINIARMLAHMPHPYRRKDARDFIARAKRNEGRACVYSITEAESGRLIGVGSLHEISEEPEPHLGYWIGEPYWGKGFATEAARALVDLYFKVTPRPILLVSARINNEASKKIIRKCGGRYTHSSEEVHPLLEERQRLDHFEITRASWMGEIAA
ncbi:MAG: GNAT family N-acetyltransferase [Nitratireductor sp.]|nr:GNAT family N-acetyltransferase [Nitratireductor sp.]